MRIKIGFIGSLAMMASVSAILAPEARAQNYCFSPGIHVISCSNCTVKLTCSLNNTSLVFTGSYVTFDADLYHISDSPDAAITATNTNVRVKNAVIWRPGLATSSSNGHGIKFTYSGPNQSIHGVENVIIYDAKINGILNSGNSQLNVSYTTVTNSRLHGVYSNGITNMYETYMAENKGTGFVANYSYSGSTKGRFLYNSQYGMFSSGTGYINSTYNLFWGGYRGLVLTGVDHPTVVDNIGEGATVYDCFDYNSNPGTHSGNRWQKAYGRNCLP